MPHSNAHSHSHTHGRGERSLAGREGVRKRLWIALLINFAFLVVEFIGGLITGSLALLSDAGHMLTDVAALGLAIVAAHLARRPSSSRATFGLLRAEVLGAFLNGITLVVIVGFVAWEAWSRLGRPQDIDAPLMLLIAVAGLAANAASALVLLPSRHEGTNVRGAFLHLAADSLGSVGAITAGVVIWTTGWTPIDLIASLIIGALILYSSIGLLWETMGILINATPADIDYDEVKAELEDIRHFDHVEDLHIWRVVSGLDILTAHVRLREDCSDSNHWQECLLLAQQRLREKFGLEHVTLQLEPPSHPENERRF